MIDTTKPMRLKNRLKYEFWKIDGDYILGGYRNKENTLCLIKHISNGTNLTQHIDSGFDLENYSEWDDVPIDTPVVCGNHFAYFSGIINGTPSIFDAGRTSLTNRGKVYHLDNIRLATPEEIKQGKILED